MSCVLVDQTLLKKAGGTAILKTFSLLFGFLVSILLARTLGPEEFGQYIFVFSIASIAALPVGTSLNQFLMRESARACTLRSPSLMRGLVKRAYLWISLNSVLVCFLLWLYGEVSLNYLVRWAFPIIPLMALVALRAEVMRGAGLVLKSQWPDMLLRPLVFMLIIGVLLVLDLLTAITALAAYGLALLVTLVTLSTLFNASVATAEYRESSLDFDDARWLTSIPWFMAISSVGAVSTLSGSVILGAANSDSAQVAAFQLGLSFSALVGLPLVVVNLVIGPQIARFWEVGDKEACLRLLGQTTRIAAVIALIGGSVVLGFPEIILGTFYGSDYEFGFRVLQILVGCQMINVAFGPVGLVLTLCGFERQAFVGQVAGLLVSISVSTMLVDSWGAVGVAVGAFFGVLVWNGCMAWQIKSYWGGPYLFLVSRVGRYK